MATDEQYVTAASRPYSLVIMLTAEHLMDKKNLGLRTLFQEFSLASKAYKSEYKSDVTIFFCTIEFTTSRDLFQKLGAEGLPYIFHISPKKNIKKAGTVNFVSEEKMSLDQYRAYPWKAEVIAEFVRKRTGLVVSNIHRDSITQSKFFVFFIILSMFGFVYIGYKLYYSPLIQNKWIWMLGVLSVFWFASSGGLFNIIRGMPFSIRGKDGRSQFFYRGQSQQLGAEGFMIGTAYILFSLSAIMITYGIPRIKSINTQRALFYTSIFLALFVLKEIVTAYTMKTGYQIEQYIFK